jgi:hypothetical protein
MAMRILVTGSRNWTDRATIENALTEWRSPGAVLVHGAAKGAGRLTEAIWRSWGLPVEPHPADWDRLPHGAAGPLRNRAMVLAGADVCLAFILPDSRGATGCAEAAGIPTYRHLRSS